MNSRTNPDQSDNSSQVLYDAFIKELSNDDEVPAPMLQSLCRMNSSTETVEYSAAGDPDRVRNFNEDEIRQFLDRIYEPVLNPEKVHGFGYDEKTLKMWLLNEKTRDSFRLLGVVGMLGVGKTALCRLILNEKDVKQHYFPRILVTLSESKEPKSMEKVVERMLEHLGVEEGIIDTISRENKLPGLLYALHLRLKGKKFLIVLDDVNEKDPYYEMLACCLRDGHGFPKAHGGAVILNGRHEKAIKKIVGEGNVHGVELLSCHDDCWEIYQTLALGEDGIHLHPRIGEASQEVKEELKKKCGGLPLAARIMGELKYREKKTASTVTEQDPTENTAKTSGEGAKQDSPDAASAPTGSSLEQKP
ncbi:hypothetical protein V6N13_076845 [Hibiscus sabdariffa]|uniref:NB-ARC domain-containing protein n=2 Tax=Hibiscus sabdariffa TaxID=183260 RepID=A0ABR2CM26_9ROSI